MSYILDALKKSEQQRQHAKVPTLSSAQTPLETPKPSRFTLHVALGMSLIGAGVLIGWLQPWQTQPAQPIAAASNAPTTPLEAPTSTAERNTNPYSNTNANARTDSLADSRGQAAPSTAMMAKTTATATIAAAAPTAEPASSTPPAPKPRIAESVGERVEISPTALPALLTNSGQTQDKRASLPLTQAELPAEIRRDLPNILIAFHQYSSAPADRRVMINNVVLRQGELIAPGLKLEQITADGVILSYMGYQFQRGVR